MTSKVIPINGENKTKLNIKVFSAERKSHQVAFEYVSNGIKVQTDFLGNHSGEDIVLFCDEKSQLKITSGHGRFTHFRTDHTFKEKKEMVCENIIIDVPKSTDSSCMFVIDTHLGKAYQFICDVCLAYGKMENANVYEEEDVMQKEKEAV